MKINDAAQIQKMYLDYVNNFLSIRSFAEHYEVTLDEAAAIISAGRIIQETTAGLHKALQKSDENVTGTDAARSIKAVLNNEGRRSMRPVSYCEQSRDFMSKLEQFWGRMPDATVIQRHGDVDSMISDILKIRNAAM